jgi:hypothetical protein
MINMCFARSTSAMPSAQPLATPTPKSNSALKKVLHAAEQDRPDIAAARRAWRRKQRRLDPRRLVFIDETAVATNMVRPLRPSVARRAAGLQGTVWRLRRLGVRGRTAPAVWMQYLVHEGGTMRQGGAHFRVAALHQNPWDISNGNRCAIAHPQVMPLGISFPPT